MVRVPVSTPEVTRHPLESSVIAHKPAYTCMQCTFGLKFVFIILFFATPVSRSRVSLHLPCVLCNQSGHACAVHAILKRNICLKPVVSTPGGAWSLHSLAFSAEFVAQKEKPEESNERAIDQRGLLSFRHGVGSKSVTLVFGEPGHNRSLFLESFLLRPTNRARPVLRKFRKLRPLQNAGFWVTLQWVVDELTLSALVVPSSFLEELLSGTKTINFFLFSLGFGGEAFVDLIIHRACSAEGRPSRYHLVPTQGESRWPHGHNKSTGSSLSHTAREARILSTEGQYAQDKSTIAHQKDLYS
mmetsp:Transcript_142/g.246  ORF Transcript_142/g.246 Transcript_142/m.246 type:complete len:300 (+) Transcript_142:183-1082(+)